MPSIRNLQILKRFTDFFKFKGNDTLDSEAGRMIVPVVNIQIPPALIQTAVTTRTSTGQSTIITTSATKRTFLTGAVIAYQHDVVADSTDFNFRISTIEGPANLSFVTLTKLSLTADTRTVPLVFDPPIELAPGTAVSITQTFTVGAGTMSGTAFFYELDD